MPNARRRILRRGAVLILVLAILGGTVLFLGERGVPPGFVTFAQSAKELDAYDFVEITAQVSAPHPLNPFTGGVIRGTFERADSSQRAEVEGFCDAEDGSVYRVRFMPSKPGDYTYSVEYRQGGSSTTSTGTFRVRDGHRRGLIRIDPEHRWHFIWE